MSTKLSFVVLFVCVLAMQFGLLASVPLADAVLPWIAAFAVLSVCWPIVSLVLGMFGVLAFDEKKAPIVEYDLSKPGHKFGYMASIIIGKAVRVVRKGASSVLNTAGKWVEPKPTKARRVVVQPLFKD